MKSSLSPNSTRAHGAWALAAASLAVLTAAAQSDTLPSLPADPPPSLAPTEPSLPSLPPGGDNSTSAQVPDRKSERFITKVSMLNSEEQRLSVIAAQRAAHDRVRAFADQLRTANSGREQELAQLAQRRSVTLPTGRDAGEAAEDNEKWRNKEAKDFDEDYVQRIIRVQKSALDTLEDYAQAHDSDPELAAFAQKHLPTVRENLRLAESLEKQVD